MVSQAQTLTAPMTAEEFFAWCQLPENAGGYHELEDGRIVEMPSASQLHGAVCALVAYFLSGYFLNRGGYVMTNDTGLIVKRRPDTVRGPDVMAFLTRPAFKDLALAHVDDVPTLVVEVLSPSDRPGKTTKRINQYLKRGIPLVWVIDPEDRNVLVHTHNQESKTLEATDELTGDGILPDFACKVGDFFAWPTPPAATTGD